MEKLKVGLIEALQNHDSYDVIKTLLDAGVLKDDHLIIALTNGASNEVVQTLLDAGALEHEDAKKYALMIALTNGASLEVLLENGVKVSEEQLKNPLVVKVLTNLQPYLQLKEASAKLKKKGEEIVDFSKLPVAVIENCILPYLVGKLHPTVRTAIENMIKEEKDSQPQLTTSQEQKL